MQALMITTLAMSSSTPIGSTPFADTCSMAFFLAGATLIAMGIYHVRKAPEQVKSPVVVPITRR